MKLFDLASWFTMFGTGTMIIAFITGTYAVLELVLGLAISICLIGESSLRSDQIPQKPTKFSYKVSFLLLLLPQDLVLIPISRHPRNDFEPSMDIDGEPTSNVSTINRPGVLQTTSSSLVSSKPARDILHVNKQLMKSTRLLPLQRFSGKA
ncbi:hypothetical protein OIU85_003055 [Salix viminalis]|uniref:Uncharacterized protein n=1 Tax=Salix viminalis TaxID=40686 RepID=A0A9Q0T0M4_SALVM|nr:hypothetical protein OIU85_003055 [Salix viminalis]